MRRKNALWMCLVSLLLFSMAIAQVGAPTTVVSVSPRSYMAPDIGHVFTVEITIAKVTDLFGFEYKLFWDPSLMNVTSYVTRVPSGWEIPSGFLVKNETGVWSGQLLPEKIGLGYHWYSYSALSGAPSFTGDLKLATYTFKVLGRGSCVLDIQGDKFVDNTATLIPHDTIDGEITTLKQPATQFSAKNIAIVIAVAVFFVVVLYYVKKRVL